jgi:hypothetical protein
MVACNGAIVIGFAAVSRNMAAANDAAIHIERSAVGPVHLSCSQRRGGDNQ